MLSSYAIGRAMFPTSNEKEFYSVMFWCLSIVQWLWHPLVGNTVEWQKHIEQNPLNLPWHQIFVYDSGWVTTVINFEPLRTITKLLPVQEDITKETCFHALFLICDWHLKFGHIIRIYHGMKITF